MDKLHKLIGKPLVVGGVGALGVGFMQGNLSGSMNVLGTSLPTPVVVAGTLLASSFLADYVADYLLPQEQDLRYARIEGRLLQPAVAGLSLVALSSLVGGQGSSFRDYAGTFATGAISEVVGAYGYGFYQDWVQK